MRHLICVCPAYSSNFIIAKRKFFKYYTKVADDILIYVHKFITTEMENTFMIWEFIIHTKIYIYKIYFTGKNR